MKKTISVSMIVKDEESVLRRCLDSLKPIATYFDAILDTGSTDSTKSIIQEYGILNESTFKNFVDSRNEALKLASGDWIVTMDADEWLDGDFNEIYKLIEEGADVIMCPIVMLNDPNSTQGETFYRPRFWKNHINIQYGGPGIHEFLIVDGYNIKYTDKIICKHHFKPDKNWEHRNQLYLDLLKDAIQKNPNDTRARFYLAKTYREYGFYQEAYDNFLAYITNPNIWFRDEKWHACYELAQCARVLDNNNAEEYWINQCFSIDNRRAEAYILYGEFFENKNDFKSAENQYKHALNCTFPTDVILFINKSSYFELPAYKLVLLYCNKLKQWNDAEEIAYRLLEEGNPELTNHNVNKHNYNYIRKMNNINYEFVKASKFIHTSKTFILQVPPLYDGLGDNFIFSHLPKIAKQSGLFDKVLISNNATFKGEGYKKIVWEYNPYIDGFTDENSEIIQNINFYRLLTSWNHISDDWNLLDSVMKFYNLDDNKRFHEPECYYKPNFLEEYKNDIIIDANGKSINLSLFNEQNILNKLNEHNIIPTAYIENPGDSKTSISFNNLKSIKTNSIEHYADIIYSCKEFVCFNTGSYFLSAGLNKKAIVLTSSNDVTSWLTSKLHQHISIH